MYVTLLRGIRKLWRGTGRAGMLKLISNPGDELVKDILPKITPKKKNLFAASPIFTTVTVLFCSSEVTRHSLTLFFSLR